MNHGAGTSDLNLNYSFNSCKMQNDFTSQGATVNFDKGVKHDGGPYVSGLAAEADADRPVNQGELAFGAGGGFATGASEMRVLEENQAYCRQRSRVTKGLGDGVDSVVRGHHNCVADEHPDVDKNHISAEQDNPINRNGITDDSGAARMKVPCSLNSSLCFSEGPKDEADRAASLCRGSGIVRSQCQINNTSPAPEAGQGTSAPVTDCIPAGAQPAHGAGHMVSASQGGDRREGDTIGGNPGTQSTEGRWENGIGITSICPLKGEPDLVIEVSGKKIQAHKSVLAEKSDYFKARQSRDILKVKGLSYKTLTVLVEYVYSSCMNVNKDNVVDVITGARILQIPCAVQAAMDTMSDQITAENCYEILTIAKKQRLNELKETAYRFMSDNFLQILKDPAVYGRLTGSERDLILKTRMEGKKSVMVAEINDVYDRVGSRPQSRNNSRPQSPLSVASFEENHMIYYYNEKTKDWRSLTMMPEDINTKGCGICTMYNYLFVAGGIKGSGDKGKLSDKVFCYNPITDAWSEIKPMNQARSQLKLVSMDGYLYAIGGECLFTVEKYDPRMDRWTPVAPLPKGAFAVAHEATTCNGEIYVSGGSLFYRLLKYDPKRDEWQECPYNNSRKKSTDMVAFKSFIYRFDVNRDHGINAFKYNTIVKMWYDSASLAQANPTPFRCAVMGNCIYCVNKTQTLRFVVGEVDARFEEEPLKAPFEAKGVLFPFILSVPERLDRSTQSV